MHKVHSPRQTRTVLEAEGTEMIKKSSAFKEPVSVMGWVNGEENDFRITEHY